MFQQLIDELPFDSGNGDFFRPRQEPGIFQALLLHGKGKSMAQLINRILAGDLADEAGQEIEEPFSRRRGRQVVVLPGQPQRLAHLLLDDIAMAA